MPLRFTPTNVFQQYLGSTIVVYHDTLGKLIGRIVQVNNTGNINFDWIKIEYYNPDNTISISQFSPRDLSAPQYYTGPLPPYQSQPTPVPQPTPWGPQPSPGPQPIPWGPQPTPGPQPQPWGPKPNIPWWWFVLPKAHYNHHNISYNYDDTLKYMDNWMYMEQREPHYNAEVKKYKDKALKAIQKAKIAVKDWNYYMDLKEDQQGKYTPNLDLSIKQAEEEFKIAVEEFKVAKKKYEKAKEKARKDYLSPYDY